MWWLFACSGPGLELLNKQDSGSVIEGDPGTTPDTTPGTTDDSDPGTTPTDSRGGDSAPPLVLSYPDQRVGMFYLAWHAYAAKAMALVPVAEQQTIEDIIAGEGSSFASLLYNRGLYNTAMAFHYHQTPSLGFYCLYRERPGEAPYAEPYTGPDCGDISTIARTHATALWDAGVDFVYVDLTNLPTWSEFGDVLGLRPFEVLLEEWAALRAAGVPTPQVAAWVPLSIGDDTAMLRRLLPIYEAYADQDLLFRPDPGDAPVIFGVGDASGYDPALVAEAAAAGVTIAPLWGLLSSASLGAGTAAWMQPCEVGGTFTTLIEPGVTCGQGWTTTSPLGTVLSVSRSYQLGYASLPLQSSGRNGGLTFQKQMETALAVQPDVLLINAWNEHIAQPQANPYEASAGGLRRSMGVSDVSDSDPTADWLWVDMHGQEFNRDFEPTVEAGDEGYQLLASCLRVYRTGARSCADASEACCQLAEGWSLVYSLRGRGGATTEVDHLLTLSSAERDALIAGGGWEEIGNPFYAPPGLSTGTETAGPFRLYPSGGDGRVALYRCYTGGSHFFSSDPACEGQTTESQLGWMATTRTSEAPRPLLRCYNPSTGVHPHSLIESCPTGLSAEAILGYVR